MIEIARDLFRNHRRLSLTPFLALGFVATACGGLAYGTGGGNGSSAPAYGGGTPPGTSSGAAATIDVRAATLGQIITDGQGRTLYLFEADLGTSSYCTSACTSVWPPFTVAQNVVAGSGTSTALISTTVRTDGQRQVTYNGHPLYYYVGDTAAGDTKGEGLNQFGAGWDVVSPQGNKIEHG